MTNVSYLYSLLLTDERPPVISQVMTRPAEVDVQDGPVLIAVDNQGLRHLLVPVGVAPVKEDHRSSGVTLGIRRLTTDTGDMRYADLACNVPRLSVTFEQLVQDLIFRLQSAPANPMATVAKALDDWRALLRQALAEVSREQIVGLVGELEILSQLAQHNPTAALDAWIGPTGAIHDFARGGTHTEVKTTASVAAGSVRVSNLDQLDPSMPDHLYLAVVHVAEIETAPSIEDRLEALEKLGVPYDELSSRVVKAGYIPGETKDVPTRFEVRGIRWWQVGSDFPGLSSSDLTPEIRASIDRVQYDLVLAALAPPMSNAEVDAHITSWMA